MPTSNGATVARQIRLWRDNTLSPQAQSHVLAAVARKRRDELIASRQASPKYETFVDGREGAAEDSVSPNGVILYRFNSLGPAATFGLIFLMSSSPVDDGDYRNSWIVAVNGSKWTGDLDDIPPDAEVMITNPKPYSRKIDVGHMRMSVPHGLVERARQAMRTKYPALQVWRQMVNIPGALGGGYVLKGKFRRGFRKHARKGLRSDTRAGEVMTYPALVFSRRL